MLRRQEGEEEAHVLRRRRRMDKEVPVGGVYLRVCAHDFTSLLVEGLTVPLRVYPLEFARQTVVFSHEHGLEGRQGDVLIGTHIP